MDPARFRFRAVRAQGVYDATHQLLIDNRVHEGRVGFEVVAPLKLGEGPGYVLVDRGWVAQGPSRARVAASAAACEEPSSSTAGSICRRARYLELGTDSNAGPIRENLDIARIAASSGLSLLPFIVEQTPGHR